MTSKSCEGLTGLFRQTAKRPGFRISSRWPSDERRMSAGGPGPRSFRISSASAIPSMPGIWKSMTAASKASPGLSQSRASAPEEAPDRHSQPAATVVRIRRLVALSSTTSGRRPESCPRLPPG